MAEELNIDQLIAVAQSEERTLRHEVSAFEKKRVAADRWNKLLVHARDIEKIVAEADSKLQAIEVGVAGLRKSKVELREEVNALGAQAEKLRHERAAFRDEMQRERLAIDDYRKQALAEIQRAKDDFAKTIAGGGGNEKQL